MRTAPKNRWGLFFCSATIVTLYAAESAAQSSEPPEGAAELTAAQAPWFVSFGAGVGYPTISHPLIETNSLVSPTFTLNGGRSLGEHLAVGIEWTGVETKVGRATVHDLFQLGYQPQAECLTCPAKVPGSDILSTSLILSTIGATAEYTPFKRDGLFVGAMAGLALMIGLDPASGFGFGARAGYRFRPLGSLSFSAEAGLEGQVYGDATMYMPYAGLLVRPYFRNTTPPFTAASAPAPAPAPAL